MEPFLGEIKMFAGNFAPTGWALCNGQTMSISQNTALFSLLGTNYGGNGTSTFQLPNFQGSSTMNQGQGTGLTGRVMGETGGNTSVTITTNQMPKHSHSGPLLADSNPGTTRSIVGGALALEGTGQNAFYGTSGGAGNDGQMAVNGFVSTSPGGNQPHDNMPPYTVITFIIAVTGIYPPRS